MQAQDGVVKNITVDQSRRQERLASIKGEMAESCKQIDKADREIQYAKADRQAAVRRLDKARKELGAFCEVNSEYIGVVR